jgi:hypothetical protein
VKMSAIASTTLVLEEVPLLLQSVLVRLATKESDDFVSLYVMMGES